MQSNKARFYIPVFFIIIAAGLVITFFPSESLPFRKQKPTIKVGILHSLTGTMAISEKQVVDATLLALEEINEHGGVLGMQIEPIVADGRSDPVVFQKEAEKLITQDKVKVIFGCWTSASRKSVKPIVEKYNSLLFYPVQYEGLEQSPNIMYMGAAPNQQLIPAVKWACDNLGKRFFLLGSDYVFPRVANEIARDVIGYAEGEVAGEEYVLLGGTDFTAVVNKIEEIKPQVILNTINGDSNISFFEALYKANIDFSQLAVMSLSIGERELEGVQRHFQAAQPGGIYACWNYFENIDTPLNKSFLAKFRNRYGKVYRVTDPMEAAYFGVYLWSQAVNECADVDDTKNIVNHLSNMSVPAPEGILSVYYNNHLAKTVRIGKANARGSFDILWSSQDPVNPVPYPQFESKMYWEGLLQSLYEKYNSRWDAGIAPDKDLKAGQKL